MTVVHCFKIVLLGAFGSSVLTAQVPTSGPPRQLTSTWEVTRDARGMETRHTRTNRRFDFGFRYVDGKPTDLLYAQEVRMTENLKLDDNHDGRVVVEAWASVRPDTGYRVRLWRRELSGSDANLLEDYYNVIEGGGQTYLSLSTGRPVVQFTEGPIYVSGGNIGMADSQYPQLVTFLSASGPLSSPRLKGVNGALGLLQFTVGDSVTSTVLLSSSGNGSDDESTPTLSLVSSDGRAVSGNLTLGGAQSAVARLAWPDGRVIVVPMRGKGFTLTGARIPAPVVARLVR
jgi:hypothetical protein